MMKVVSCVALLALCALPLHAESHVAPGFTPEPQEVTGRFTTATEVRPILAATRASWLALRDYGGQDLLYFTHLLAWRCGLHRIRFAVNGGPAQVYEAEPCHTETASPNAIVEQAAQPYLAFPAGSVGSVTVSLTFDDGSEETADFARASILMP